jgi:chemotaxis protein histidine kinase CheA
VRRTIEDLEALVRGGEGDDDADGRVRRALDRWKEVGVDIPEEGGADRSAGQISEASRQFRQFAAHEIAGIVAEMEVSLETLANDPRNRDPLKSIMRRQRAMMGAARLDEIPIVAEALRATEDLTRVIAKLNVPVKEEWLSVFRSSRDVLKSALAPLQKGETPTATPALSKLRVLRQELLDRFGEGEAVPVTGGPPQQQAVYTAPAAAPAPPPAPAAPAAAPAAPAPVFAMAGADDDDAVNIEDLDYDDLDSDVVPIEDLQYSGARALQRALELRPQLERLVAADPSGRESVEEIFDLIKLGIV